METCTRDATHTAHVAGIRPPLPNVLRSEEVRDSADDFCAALGLKPLERKRLLDVLGSEAMLPLSQMTVKALHLRRKNRAHAKG